MSLASMDMKQLMTDLRAACVDLATVEAHPAARVAWADVAPPLALDGALEEAERRLLVLREARPGLEAERAVRWLWMAQGRLQRYPRPVTWDRAAVWGEDLGWLVASAAESLREPSQEAPPAEDVRAGALTALRACARICREWAAHARAAVERAARPATSAPVASFAACCG